MLQLFFVFMVMVSCSKYHMSSIQCAFHIHFK